MLKKFLVLLLLSLTLLLGISTIAFSQEKILPGEYYNMTDYEKLSGKKITKFSEPPQLAELVKQGKLPPVEQRLPKNPLVESGGKLIA